MATETHSWSNQPTLQQGASTPRILVPPYGPSIPCAPVLQQGFVTTKTWVDPKRLPVPNQPAPQQAFNAWPDQPMPQRQTAVWPNQPAPQQSQGTLGDWADLKVPQPWSSAPEVVDPALKAKRKGRGVVAWTLWVFAGGLFVGPQVTDYADRAVEDSIAWLATSAPGFVRPYLPKPLEALAAAPLRVVPSAVAPAVPAEPTATPQRRPEIIAQPTTPVAGPSPRDVATERPSKDVRPHAVHGKHGKVALAVASDEATAPIAEKAPEPKHGGGLDPFESATDGAGAPAVVKSQPAKSHGSLDDLMGDGPSAGGKAHEKHSTSREIDAMLKDVQKSDPAPAPKRVEPAAAAPSLTAADISRVMGGVKSNAAECGKRFGESGVADLKLTVGKDGRISSVAIRGKLADTPVGRCVVQAARNAEFPLNSGLTFDYRIDVH
jgi:hypothetical protein